MGRPRKTDRIDEDFDDESRSAEAESPREKKRDTFETEMFADEITSPFHIPKEEWPDGMALRWISIEVTGAPDNRNWSLKTAAHWTPVTRGKYPKIDRRLPTVPMPGMGGNNSGSELLIFGGLCLCERDIRYNMRDMKKQADDTMAASRTIESYVEGGNPNMPRKDFGSSPVQYERGVARASFKGD